MKTFLYLFLPLLLLIGCKPKVTEPLILDTPFDVFPLAKGASFHYAYTDTVYIHDGYNQEHHIDSGYVEYRVIDSVRVADSLRQWTIQEHRHLFHKVTKFNFSTDVEDVLQAGWQDSTISLNLAEGLTGMHELRCDGLIWSFPAQLLYVPGESPIGQPVPVYRYATKKEISVKVDTTDLAAALTMSDSSNFAEGSGLTYRQFDQGGGAHHIWDCHIHSRLIGN